MKAGNVLSMLRILSFLGFTLFFGLSLHLGLSIFSHGTGDDMITGMVPLSTEDTDIEPTFTEEDLSVSVLEERQNLILDECSRAHRNSADCYNLVRSIISVSSRGEESDIDLGKGLIPLRESQTDLDSDELMDTETNVREAIEYIMRLYDTYNGDLAFTSMAYIAGRSISNNIMYNFYEMETDSSITLSTMLDTLRSTYETMENDINPVLSLEDISQYYVDILFAYNFWADQPMIDPDVEEMMYDHGTYSIYPSFSTQIRYDLRYMEDVVSTLSEYIEQPPESAPSNVLPSTGNGEPDTESTEEGDLSFMGLLAFMMDEHDEDEYEVSEEDGNIQFSMDNMTWKEGMCNPMLDKFNRVVDRFIQCVELDEMNCYCDFSDIIFDYDDYEIFMEVRESTTEMGIPRKDMTFELRRDASGVRTEGELMASRTHLSYLEGSREQEFVFGGLGEFHDSLERLRNDQVTFINTDGESWFGGTLEYHPGIYKGELEEKIGLALVPVNNNNLDLDLSDSCGIEKEYEHICIESETAYAYDEVFFNYTQVGHQFAFMVDPLELRDEHYDVELDELTQRTIEIGDDEESQISLDIYPGASCESSPRCSEDIILGKPASYSNSRDMIVLHHLPYRDSSIAMEYYKASLSSDTENEAMLDESHHSTHYLIEDGFTRHTKLAREDAILYSSGPFDSRSIHVGLITNSFDDDYILEVSEMLAEIMIRNEIDSESIFASDSLDFSEIFEDDLSQYYEELDYESFNAAQEEMPLDTIRSMTSLIISEYEDN